VAVAVLAVAWDHYVLCVRAHHMPRGVAVLHAERIGGTDDLGRMNRHEEDNRVWKAAVAMMVCGCWPVCGACMMWGFQLLACAAHTLGVASFGLQVLHRRIYVAQYMCCLFAAVS
jgi:hypothetical protein